MSPSSLGRPPVAPELLGTSLCRLDCRRDQRAKEGEGCLDPESLRDKQRHMAKGNMSLQRTAWEVGGGTLVSTKGLSASIRKVFVVECGASNPVQSPDNPCAQSLLGFCFLCMFPGSWAGFMRILRALLEKEEALSMGGTYAVSLRGVRSQAKSPQSQC